MTRKDIEKKYMSVCEQVMSRHYRSALSELHKFVRFGSRAEYHYQLETLNENYRSLLHYAWDGKPDPGRQEILDRMCAGMLEMAEALRQELIEPGLPMHRSERLQLQSETGTDPDGITRAIEEIYFHREVNRLIGEGNHDPVRQNDFLFKLFWLTEKYPESCVEMAGRILRSSGTEWPEKCLILSGITLGLITRFDPQRFSLLIDAVLEGEDQVSQRALTGLVLGLILHDRKVSFYPLLVMRLKELAETGDIIPRVELILMQLLKARETEKITREFEDQVLPEMKKMMPRIEDKLQLNDETEDDLVEGKNPGWKDIMDEVPGLYEKVEKFSRMQMEGGDVFMSTFQMLKRFDFFNSMSNWFIPFYGAHPEVRNQFPPDDPVGQPLIESLENAFYICNSDKYSFIVNFRMIPEQQRTLIVTNFEAEFAQMKEMATEEQMLDHSLTANAIFIQYIQDLYRFFKLYPSRLEFEDVFQARLRLNESWFYTNLFYRPGFPEKVAAFHFDNDHYFEAIDEYEMLLAKKGPEHEYFEKIGYCYQKAGLYKKALEYYRKAELYDADRPWILRRLGWCCMKTEDYAQAYGYLKEAMALSPDDLKLQMQAGQCLLSMKQFEEALHLYGKIRYFRPDDLKVLRPLAWCQFVTGRLKEAATLYETILESASPASPYDSLNAGHVTLCLGNRREALRLYTLAFSQGTAERAILTDAFDHDQAHLISNGIPEEEIPLLRDHISYLSEPS